jgi:Rod binding domain-containing protein
MTIGINAATALSSSNSSPDAKEKQKETGASKDFEALLIGQMLRSVREEGSGWLGTGEDQASAAAFGFGEEQLAKALTAGGGLGLSKVIATGLAAKNAAATAGRADVSTVLDPSAKP